MDATVPLLLLLVLKPAECDDETETIPFKWINDSVSLLIVDQVATGSSCGICYSNIIITRVKFGTKRQ